MHREGARPLDLAVVTNLLSLGGTEKTVVNHVAALDRERVRPRVVAVMAEGPRRAELDALGVPVACAHSDEDRLTELLAGADVVHVHRAGGPEPIVPAAARRAGVRWLVETNVFGLVDRTEDERVFACHLFPSEMCSMRHRQAVGLDLAAFHARHRTSYYPVDPSLAARAPARDDAARALGLDPARPVVARVGRDDDRKWGDVVVDMLPPLLARVPDVQVLLVGATPAKRERLRRLGLLDRVRLEPPTADAGRLASFYAACDVFVTASSIGETFGVALGEAMVLGRPVVTTSTPWTDNAQVELVDHGVTGYLASHPATFAEAVAALLADEPRRAAFGRAGAEKARRLYDPAALTRQHERLYEALVTTGSPPEAWSPSREDLAAFERDYPRRARAEFRALSPRERLEVRAARLRERGGWALRDLRSAPWQRVGRVTVERARRALPGRAARSTRPS